MATPYSSSNNSAALSTEPSRTLLQQLLEEINGASVARGRNVNVSHSPASIRSLSSSQNHSPSVWVGGSSFAEDAREKLRAVDEARRHRSSPVNVDAASGLQTAIQHFDTLGLQAPRAARTEHEKDLAPDSHHTPDPVKNPHEYMQYMMKGSPLSTTVGQLSAARGHDNTAFHEQAPSSGNDTAQPLSPVMFSDIDFDDSSSSPRTNLNTSPIEAPISAATMYTTEQPRTPAGQDKAGKRFQFSDEMHPEASPKKKRTLTLPDIRTESYSRMATDAPHCFIGVGGDNRCVLRDETFIERAPDTGMSTDLATSGVLPELSSFRPTAADSRGQAALSPRIQKLTRAFTTPIRPSSPTIPETPAWMRSMHLVDTGGRSIYMNVHDDGPIRHALCLHCFRTQGSFCKVHRYGYESCGRAEVLDSHYWEDDAWPEESSDESI